MILRNETSHAITIFRNPVTVGDAVSFPPSVVIHAGSEAEIDADTWEDVNPRVRGFLDSREITLRPGTLKGLEQEIAASGRDAVDAKARAAEVDRMIAESLAGEETRRGPGRPRKEV